MKYKNLLCYVFFINLCINVSVCEFLTWMSSAVIVPLAYVGYKNYQYKYCDASTYFKKDVLKQKIRTQLFGQHLVETIVIPALDGFLKNPDPKSPLVMSFHGTTGSGKNFVSKLIAESMYKDGMQSPYVKLYVANIHFPDKHLLEFYKKKIRNEVVEATSACPRNLFIFDEVEKMPPGLLNSLKSFLDYHESINGVDYRKNIFIFLSNLGSQSIINVALQFWQAGRSRGDIAMKDIEPLLEKGAFNIPGGFQKSDLLSAQLVDFLVPFFPLEKNHVEECIRAFYRERLEYVDEPCVKVAAEQLTYFPENVELFAFSGCKRIETKIALCSQRFDIDL